MSELMPSTWASSSTSPTEAVWAVDSMPRTTIVGKNEERVITGAGRVATRCRTLPTIRRWKRTFLPRMASWTPVGKVERLAYRDLSTPLVDEVVAFGLLAEPHVLEAGGDVGVRGALAIELEEKERLRHRIGSDRTVGDEGSGGDKAHSESAAGSGDASSASGAGDVAWDEIRTATPRARARISWGARSSRPTANSSSWSSTSRAELPGQGRDRPL